MITAIDTSVLIAIAKGEPDAVPWVDLLARARPQGELVICDVVAAEFFAVLLDEGKFVDSLTRSVSFSARPRSKPRGWLAESSRRTAARAAHESTSFQTS